MLIKGVELEEETVLEIGKFTILWGLFEEKYCENGNTSNQLEDVYSQIPIAITLQNVFAQTLQNRREITRERNYVDNGIHYAAGRPTKKAHKDMMKAFVDKSLDENTNIGCLLVIRRIRNNVAHGLKDIKDLNGQLTLFKAMNDVLESII